MWPVYNAAGVKVDEVELPAVFGEPIRPDIILRAALAEATLALQPKGAYWRAGLETSAKYVGRKEAYHTLKNVGMARLPRQMFPKGRIGLARIVPWAVKGRRAFPPRPEKIIIERINFREQQKALRSAIAATADARAVKLRHKVDVPVPIIFDESVERIAKTKEALALLRKFIAADLERVALRRKRRLKRKRGYYVPRSALVVTTSSTFAKAVRNIPGIDVAPPDKLTFTKLAPGGIPGRLTIYTMTALLRIGEIYAKSD